MLHIQEVGMAPPGVINALLKIRGEMGKLATDIQVHEDGGRLIEAGEGFFLVLSTNPPGAGFKERFELDSALARALVWKTLPNELSQESMEKVAGRIFDFSRVNRKPDAPGAIVDLCEHSELSKLIGAVALRFHLMYQGTDKSEPGRKQRIPATIDSLWKVAELIQNNQIPYDNLEGIDFIETLRTAIRGIYIDCLRGKPSPIPASNTSEVAERVNSLGSKLLKQLHEILNDSTKNAATLRGSKMSHEKAIEELGKAAFENSVQKHATIAVHNANLNESLRDLEQLLTPDLMDKVRNKVSP
jgi:hypothetical protein